MHVSEAVVIISSQARDPQRVLEEAHKLCSKLGIHHSTIQVQDSANAVICCQNPQVQCM